MCNELLNNKEYINIQTGEALDLDKVHTLPDNAMLKINNNLWCIWDFEKNDALGFDIWKMTKGLKRKAIWYCDVCDDRYPQTVESKVRGTGCSYCNGKLVNMNNCILTTNPDIAKMMLIESDKFEYTQFSDKRVDWKCPECDNVIRNKAIKNISNFGLSCPNCSEGISYPEKAMYSLLRSINVEFTYDTSTTWSNSKRYDFVLLPYNIIIETHGAQHYSQGFKLLSTKSLEEEQSNDQYKYELAIQNGINPENYIVIDCRKSDFEFIKNNIMNSRLTEIFDLNNVDWNAIESLMTTKISKNVLDLYIHSTKDATEISKVLNVTKNMVMTILRKFNKSNKIDLYYSNYKKQVVQLDKNNNVIKIWDSYSDANRVFKNVGKVLAKEREAVKDYKFMYYSDYEEFANKLDEFPFYENKIITKKVVQLSKDFGFIKEWNSLKEASDSVGLANPTSISLVCRGKKKTAKNFKWMYLSDYEKMIEEQNKIS